MKTRLVVILSVVSTFIGLGLIGLIFYLLNRERRVILDLSDETPQIVKDIAYDQKIFPQSFKAEALLFNIFNVKSGGKLTGLAKYLTVKII